MFEGFANSRLFNSLSRRFRKEFMRFYIEHHRGGVDRLMDDLVRTEGSFDINFLIDVLNLDFDWIEKVIQRNSKSNRLHVVNLRGTKVVERMPRM